MKASPATPAGPEDNYTPPQNTPEGLSNPPSGTSTPRSITNSLLGGAKPDLSPTGTPRSQASEEDQKSGMLQGFLEKPSCMVAVVLRTPNSHRHLIYPGTIPEIPAQRFHSDLCQLLQNCYSKPALTRQRSRFYPRVQPICFLVPASSDTALMMRVRL